MQTARVSVHDLSTSSLARRSADFVVREEKRHDEPAGTYISAQRTRIASPGISPSFTRVVAGDRSACDARASGVLVPVRERGKRACLERASYGAGDNLSPPNRLGSCHD